MPGPHQWSTVPLDNQTADVRAQFQEGQPASSLNNGMRGAMTTSALARDDGIGLLVATLGANNTYTVQTNQGLIDPKSTAGGGTAKITKPFLIRLGFDTALSIVKDASGAVTNPPKLAIDGAAAIPLFRQDGSALANADLVTTRPYEILGDTLVSGAVTRARVLGTLPSNLPAPVDLGPVYQQIETRGQAYADSAVNRSVTGGRWVLAGSKSFFDQPGTGGFISPFGGHTMYCDYWSYQFLDANGVVQSAPFAVRFRAFQVYIANQGWVTCGAAS